ncbi:MAG: hypothetical protein ACOYYU_17935 [Chloroflexota bacterium]
MSRTLTIVGLAVALLASALLLVDMIEPGIAAALGILGIGLVAASRRWLRPQTDPQARPEQVVQTIYAPDRQLRALVKQRADGNYQVEIQKFIHDYSPDVGSHDRWERQSNLLVTDTLARAVEIAAGRVGAGTGDFFGEKA